MNAKMPLRNWILTKLMNYLVKSEGCEVVSTEVTAEGQKAFIQDAFGFRYSLEIRALSRINSDTEGLDQYADFKKSSALPTNSWI